MDFLFRVLLLSLDVIMRQTQTNVSTVGHLCLVCNVPSEPSDQKIATCFARMRDPWITDPFYLRIWGWLSSILLVLGILRVWGSCSLSSPLVGSV